MRRELLLLIITIQISPIRTLKDACDARSGNSCNQMSDSLEEEKDNMGLFHSKRGSPFPTTLEGFGYQFNIEKAHVATRNNKPDSLFLEYGQLRNIETDEPFKFEVKEGDRAYNQKHYEALGEVITEYVYKLLEEEVKLKKHIVPVDAKEGECTSFIFMSDDAMTKDKLMILIHGSGVVRAGQWARRLIINNDMNSGTMLPYIKRASQEGFGVVITNGNENYIKKRKHSIKGSETPEKHFVYVWDNFISKAAAQSIVVVAHSYGGIVIVEGLQTCKGIMDRIKAVAFTDSVHSLAHQRANKKLLQWMKRNSRNWVSSDLPLDDPVSSMFKGADCEMVSAGTTQHELTSHIAFDSIFKFFEEKLNQKDSSENQKDDSDSEMDTSENQASATKDKVDENQADASLNKEDSSQSQKDAPENQADASLAEEDSSQSQNDGPENQADASLNNEDSSQSQKDAPESQADTSLTKEGSSQSQKDAPESQADTSLTKEDSSQSQKDVPENQADASLNKEDSPQSLIDSPENQAEDSQMETDS